ncbi:reverse transcriptase domain-containing protein [Tanacetum coccineum]
MADNRTMAQMLQAPIEGYEDAIVVPPINANNFELKQPLINLVQSNKFTEYIKDPHNHLRFFNKVTSTFRHPEVPNTSVKLLLFPFSLDGEARDWLDKEPPRSILTWDDLVSKFINQYFPPSKTTYYRNEIITFYQKPNEAFNEAWERFKGLLRQCPHHGFSELHQLDTFYNSLNSNDQDALRVLQQPLLFPSQTVTNPRQQINAITTRSGKALEEPSIPLVPSPDVSKPQKEPEQNPETSTEKVQNPNLENTTHVPSPGEEDSIFMEIPKPKANNQIGLKDALVEMPKFNKWLSSLLRNKEKLEEIAITTVNAECSAIHHTKFRETRKIRENFLIPIALQELKKD